MAEQFFDVTDPKLKKLDRRDMHLRRMTTVLVAVLGLTVVLLYLPQVLGFEAHWLPAPETHRTLAVGILGLALLFYLYVSKKLGELTHLRRDLLGSKLRAEQLRGRLSELSSLFETTSRASTQVELSRMLDVVVRRILISLEADQSSIMLLDAERNVLKTTAFAGADDEFVCDSEVPVGEGVAGWVAKENQPLVLDDAEMAQRFPDQHKRGRDIASALSVPLSFGDDVVGVLNVNRLGRVRPFTPMDARLVMIFAEHVATSIRKIEKLSSLDEERNTLQESNQQLTELGRMKETFLAAAKHEMKTPLAAIVASSELLLRDGVEAGPDRHDKLVRTIHEQAVHLRDLVSDIVELSRLEGGTIELDRKSVQLDEIVREAIRAVEGMSAHRGIRFDLDLAAGSEPVFVDRVKIRQVVLNLLTNAIKFSPPEGLVEITTRIEGGNAILDVRDHGRGIRREATDRIFQLFARGDDTVRKAIEGLGIGLFLVKRYVEIHRGNVSVESDIGMGSLFRVTLPIEVSSSGNSTESAPTESASAVSGASAGVVPGEEELAA